MKWATLVFPTPISNWGCTKMLACLRVHLGVGSEVALQAPAIVHAAHGLNHTIAQGSEVVRQVSLVQRQQLLCMVN